MDPVTFGVDGRTGMINRYSYGLNDPINMFDKDGNAPDHVMDQRAAAVSNAIRNHPEHAAIVALGAAGVAAVVFDVVTIPSGEGIVAATALKQVAKQLSKDAALGVASAGAIDVAVQVGINDVGVTDIDVSQAVGSAVDGALPGIAGASIARQGNKIGKAVTKNSGIERSSDAFENAVESMSEAVVSRSGSIGTAVGGTASSANSSAQKTCRGSRIGNNGGGSIC